MPHLDTDRPIGAIGWVISPVETPTHWGNMSSQLKVLFDRIVPVFIGERPNGIAATTPHVMPQSPWPSSCCDAHRTHCAA